MSSSFDDDVKKLKGNLDKLERSLSSADEDGLFENIKNVNHGSASNVPTHDNILDKMVACYQELERQISAQKDKSVIQAWKTYRQAHNQFDEALNSASFWWRFEYSFGGPFILYFIALLAFAFLAWLFFNPSLSGSKLLWVPAWAFLWGLIGGVLQGLWFLWQHVSDRKVRKAWIPWYFLLPLMGAILGALTYLVFIAGFIAVTGGAQGQSEYFGMLLSGLAGFSTRWAVETLDKLTNLMQVGK